MIYSTLCANTDLRGIMSKDECSQCTVDGVSYTISTKTLNNNLQERVAYLRNNSAPRASYANSDLKITQKHENGEWQDPISEPAYRPALFDARKTAISGREMLLFLTVNNHKYMLKDRSSDKQKNEYTAEYWSYGFWFDTIITQRAYKENVSDTISRKPHWLPIFATGVGVSLFALLLYKGRTIYNNTITILACSTMRYTL